MKEQQQQPIAVWWNAPFRRWTPPLPEREEQVFLALTLLIGALVGAIVVAFILLTERSGGRLYPAGGAAWRRLMVPVVGSLGIGYLTTWCQPYVASETCSATSGRPQRDAASASCER